MGQSWNAAGIRAVWSVWKCPALARPHQQVPDIRHVDWAALKKTHQMTHVLFDKDNTLTAPYAPTVWPPLRASLRACQATFGADRVYVHSNSIGSADDPRGVRAEQFEAENGVRVLRHGGKKPDVLEARDWPPGMVPAQTAIVGDRLLTDMVMGNRMGMHTILVQPFCLDDDNVMAAWIRRLEQRWLRWCAH
ncbi:hypothetical protein CXG81DRAFT_24038 [Caulochytrium protostelioides]|uniref:HAD-superfamily phosphatase n=1 Tax=Caulochytrium protostelioides TaxID=1555241 RepID=A0A4P9XD64_9FUNG|nr:HAD-superfamily phosphatase [Caulochytrium protostelioides]RKP03383.1 hypothetical protein CXG81DRAFT_24038 [Caulochytrium protostelioides]|eukprot:RKP03383.1 hypothetical protein CXG81DRAFT_24038 [Caulochytrium protostelioides]